MEDRSEVEKLAQAIQALEEQRQTLGDEVVEVALAPLHEKLASLQASLGGEQRKLVSVLFSDLVGFTSFASRMDPEDVREVINAYFQRWSACIKRQEGVIEKYIGDAVLAVFGLPAAHEDDPERAIRAALEMQKKLVQLNEWVESEYGLRLSFRVGINTGEVVVSLLGERQGEEFIVVGETVNLASRIQAGAPIDSILITHDTYRHVRGLFETAPYGPLQLKGIDHPIQAYLITAAKPRSFRLDSRGIEGMETPLVGRQDELDRMKQAFYQVIEQNEHYSVTLVGEAGIGKSRLLFEFENWLELLPERIIYFSGRAYPSTQHLPYSLIRDMFAVRCQIQDRDPPLLVRSKLEANIAPLWGGENRGQMRTHIIAHLLGFEIGESEYLHAVQGDAKSLHDRALAYLGEYFKALGAEGPAVVLLEDLHWADESSLNLIEQMENLLAGQPFLVVGTTRPSLFERRPHWGEGLTFHIRINLSPLNLSASKTLVEEILSKVDSIPSELLSLLVDKAEGNPFFLEELIKMLIEDGVILKEGAQWRVDEQRLGNLRVPQTLIEVLQARFDVLEPQSRNYLQRGAVIGRVFWDQAVQALSASTGSKIPGKQERIDSLEEAETIDHLTRREIIFRQKTSSFENTAEYLFKHALLRDVTYSSLLKRERRIYHGRAARWLEKVTGHTRRWTEFTMLIAEHYELAGESGQASEWFLLAGRAAAARFANSEAVRAFSQALKLSANTDPLWKFTVLAEREKVYELLGKRNEQRADLNAIQAAAEIAGEPSLLAKAALRWAHYSFQTADYPAAMESARRAEELAERNHNVELAAQSNLLEASISMRQGEFEHSRQYAQRALNLIGEQGETGILAEGYRHLGLVDYYTGNPQLARHHFGEALKLYEQAENRQGEAMALNNLGSANFNLGEYDEARSYYTRSLELSNEIGDRLGECRGYNNLGIIAVTQGAYALAEEYYLQALLISREVGQRSNEVSALDNLGNLASFRYHYSQAKKYQLESLRGAREIGDRVAESFSLINISRLYLSLGEYDRARDYIHECLDLNQQLGDQEGNCHSLIILSQWLVTIGETQSALDRCEKALAIARESDIRSTEGWALHVMGLILLDLGHSGEAANVFKQALEIRLELAETRDAIETQAELGLAYLALGDLQHAIECAETILTHINQHGIEGFDRPFKVFLNCYQILSTAQDARAGGILSEGHKFLQEVASNIEIEATRQAYLERVPENRALIAAWIKAGPPSIN